MATKKPTPEHALAVTMAEILNKRETPENGVYAAMSLVATAAVGQLKGKKAERPFARNLSSALASALVPVGVMPDFSNKTTATAKAITAKVGSLHVPVHVVINAAIMLLHGRIRQSQGDRVATEFWKQAEGVIEQIFAVAPKARGKAAQVNATV